jgi:hypothetical protein
VIAAKRIGDECHAFSIGEPVQLDYPVLCAVVDSFVHPALEQEGVLCAAAALAVYETIFVESVSLRFHNPKIIQQGQETTPYPMRCH